MATLRGQNFRVMTYDSDTQSYKVIASSTNCVITLTNNTQDTSTKDDVGMAEMPEITTKAAQVQVDSLSVSDAATLLTAIKNKTLFSLLWCETDTSDNQTAKGGDIARTVSAYLTDITFNFNNREYAAKNVTFTCLDDMQLLEDIPDSDPVPLQSPTEGQFIRLFLSQRTAGQQQPPSTVIAAARQLSLHISVGLEDVSTKDTPGKFLNQEPVSISWDISTTALVRGNDIITSAVTAKNFTNLQDIYNDDAKVNVQIANVSGDNQRTKGTVILTGTCQIQSLTLNAPNRQVATWTAQLQGYGIYT